MAKKSEFQKQYEKMTAQKRPRVMNSGYSEGGASLHKNSLMGFTGESKSPYDDINRNLHILRQRCRLLYMQAPIASAAIKANRTNIIGPGLRIKSRIDFRYLGLSKQAADDWERHVEREFNLWAESRFCDSKGLDNFFELQNIALTGEMLNGDSFALLHHRDPPKGMPYGLRIQLIEADRITTPNTHNADIIPEKGGGKIYNGVEVDSYGQVIAYHICNTYPHSNYTVQKKWIRVEAHDNKTGIPNILHIMNGERAEQYRGVPYLAPIIESLKQISRYMDAEQMAAVVNSYFTIFIETEDGDSNEFDGGEYDDESNYRLGNGIINILRKGERVSPVDPKRPNVNFDGFTEAMCKYMGAGIELPYEMLLKSFNSNYSASRAAILEAWKMFKMRRSWFANDFCQPIYEAFLSEAVARGRIYAPGFFSDPLARKAWCQSEWNGPAQGQIDPKKEVEAARERIALGISNRERETMEQTGGDFDRTIEQLLLEAEVMRALKEEG